jgi:hypothetical protein
VTGTPELVQLVKALLPTLPKRFQAEFQALLADAERSTPISLVGVVAMCCQVLEDGGMDAGAWTQFTEAAWDLITFMVRAVVHPIRARANLPGKAKPGEILPVPAKTHFLVALLLAKIPDPRQLLLPTSKGPVPRDDLSPAARFIPFEPGPAEADRMFQFEALLWKRLFPTEPVYTLGCKDSVCVPATCARDCDKRDLYGRLGADAEKGRPHFVMIDPGSGAAWKDIAAKAKEVVFVEPEVGATDPLNEDRLAYLISDFLKLSASKESV